MYDNKIRLSPDVLEKAELIAQEWGLKNARAAVEAVFRRYADDYRRRQPPTFTSAEPGNGDTTPVLPLRRLPQAIGHRHPAPDCEALNALDELLGL